MLDKKYPYFPLVEIHIGIKSPMFILFYSKKERITASAGLFSAFSLLLTSSSLKIDLEYYKAFFLIINFIVIDCFAASNKISMLFYLA